ncbi:MAG: TIGR00282 family metallophosphoesterase [Clostridia bacterium]|nr:TIGR00282 family metallophosphoesterase [Clostridia bacterium]
MNILFIGDVVGRPGRDFLTDNLNRIKRDYKIDFCICNGENSAHGNGCTYETARQLFEAGADIITMGNHTFKNNTQKLFDDCEYVIRPINYPSTLPGEGSIVFDTGSVRIGVINAQGRIFMDPLDSPFTACKKEVERIKNDCDIIVIDFHAETTSEKAAMAHYLDGEVTAVLGTHTHVQTADEAVLEKGTAFISDVGMTGVKDSILGVDKHIIVDRFVNHINQKFVIAEGKVMFNGVIIEADPKTKKALGIKRLNF